jgi:hypothetical protein
MMRLGILSLAGATVLGLAGPASAEPDKPEHANSAARRAHPVPSGSGFHLGQAELAESFRKHRPNQEELKAAMTAAREGAKVRREARILEVRQRYGLGALSRREVLDELRVHARRMAFLNRAKLVATTELEEPKRAKALARIDKLTAAEKTRHEERIAKLRATSPGDADGNARPGPSGAPSGAPPVPSGSAGMGTFRPRGPALGPPGAMRPPAAKGSAP